MHESINFGIEKFPIEADGTYIAYTPLFNKLPAMNASRYVDIIFFRSLNYHNNKSYIVGLYASPIIGKVFRKAKHKYYKYYDFGNIKSKPENIILFKHPIEIDNRICKQKMFLPSNKKLGLQGFNYLTALNVSKILKMALKLNPSNRKLSKIITSLTE